MERFRKVFLRFRTWDARSLRIQEPMAKLACPANLRVGSNDEVVLKTATITKLTRNVLLAGVIPALAYSHASIRKSKETPKFSFQLVQKHLVV